MRGTPPMADYLTLFARLYRADMPGVVAVTLGDASVIHAHYWAEPATDADGMIDIQSTHHRLQAPASSLSTVKRNDTLAIAGKTFRCASKPMPDGHGISTLYLEAL